MDNKLNENEDLSRFTDQFNDTVNQLHAVWRETGLPEMEQKKSIDLMKKEVFQVNLYKYYLRMYSCTVNHSIRAHIYEFALSNGDIGFA